MPGLRVSILVNSLRGHISASRGTCKVESGDLKRDPMRRILRLELDEGLMVCRQSAVQDSAVLLPSRFCMFVADNASVLGPVQRRLYVPLLAALALLLRRCQAGGSPRW